MRLRQFLVQMEPETVVYANQQGVSLSLVELATLNTNIRSVKYGSGLTLSSLTAKFSTVAPTFVTQCSQDLRWLAILNATTPLTLTWNDGTNTLAMYPVAAGTGETYLEMITSWTNSGYETFTPDINGHDITSAINTTSSAYLSKALSAPFGKLYKLTANITVNSGAGPTYYTRAEVASGTYGTFSTGGTDSAFSTNMTRILISSSDTNDAYFVVRNASGAGDFRGTISFSQVLTPSATGFTASDLSGASFNPNAAIFALTVTRR